PAVVDFGSHRALLRADAEVALRHACQPGPGPLQERLVGVVASTSLRGMLAKVSIELVDLARVLEVFLVDDLAPPGASEEHRAIVVDGFSSRAHGLRGEEHADMGAPRRSVDQDLMGLADDPVREVPAQEVPDAGLAAVGAAP